MAEGIMTATGTNPIWGKASHAELGHVLMMRSHQNPVATFSPQTSACDPYLPLESIDVHIATSAHHRQFCRRTESFRLAHVSSRSPSFLSVRSSSRHDLRYPKKGWNTRSLSRLVGKLSRSIRRGHTVGIVRGELRYSSSLIGAEMHRSVSSE